MSTASQRYEFAVRMSKKKKLFREMIGSYDYWRFNIFPEDAPEIDRLIKVIEQRRKPRKLHKEIITSNKTSNCPSNGRRVFRSPRGLEG